MKKMMKKFIIFAIVAVMSFTTFAAPMAQVNAATIKTVKTKATTIVNQQTKKNDTKKVKLKKLFKYAEKKYGYARAYGFKNKKGWQRDYAVEMYNKKKGSCYHFAAAYAYLAKKATGYQVRIGLGKTNGFNKNILQDHAWVEVKIGKTWYICDPNMDKFAAKSSLKYYLKERNSAAMKKVYNKYKNVKYVNVTF